MRALLFAQRSIELQGIRNVFRIDLYGFGKIVSGEIPLEAAQDKNW